MAKTHIRVAEFTYCGIDLADRPHVQVADCPGRADCRTCIKTMRLEPVSQKA